MSTLRIATIAVSTVDGMVGCNYHRTLRLGEISLRNNPHIILFPEAFAAGYCGDVEFESWTGEAPITVNWRLLAPVPEHLRRLLNVP